MVRGLRVVFSPNPVSRALCSYAVPASGTRGTVTAVHTAGGLRTYLDGPGGGLVYVEGIPMAPCAACPCATSRSSQPRRRRRAEPMPSPVRAKPRVSQS
jgi:hypothetical protein